MFGRKKNRYFFVVATGHFNNQNANCSLIVETHGGKFLNIHETSNNIKETFKMTNPVITFFKEISESDMNDYVEVIK